MKENPQNPNCQNHTNAPPRPPTPTSIMTTPQEPNTNSSSPDYKAQLDDLAVKARQPPQSPEENKPEGTGAVIVDKGKPPPLPSLPGCLA